MFKILFDLHQGTEKYSREWFAKQYTPTFSDCGENGLNICGIYIPEEIMHLILGQLDSKSLLQCRLVCHGWRYIIDSEVLFTKLNKKVSRLLQTLYPDSDIPFPVWYNVLNKESFNRNLIKNPCGEEGFSHWKIRSNGGDKWIVENPPVGSSPLLEGSNSCFVTSFSVCCKEQLIDLKGEGLLPIVMDEIKPKIYVSEKYAARFDCASTYVLDVVLMDRNHEEIDKFHMKQIEQRFSWQIVEHCFENYPRGVRYIRFMHSGIDNQFWKGHYGSKMTEACVKVII